MKANERAFEDAIEASLLEGRGYGVGSGASFDAALGLDSMLLFGFLRATQEKPLAQLVSRYGGAGKDAESGFFKRLAAEIDDRGTLDVLRHGVVDQGIAFVCLQNR